MSDYKINQSIKQLIKIGLEEDIAAIVACANNNVPEKAEDIIAILEQEQQVINEELKNFIPLNENIKLVYSNGSNFKEEVSNIQYQQ